MDKRDIQDGIYTFKLTRDELDKLGSLQIHRVQEYKACTLIEGMHWGNKFKVKGNTESIKVEIDDSTYEHELIRLLVYMGYLPMTNDYYKKMIDKQNVKLSMLVD